MPDSIRILVLEDDGLMREAIRSSLEDEGYTVCAAASGIEAIEQAKAGPFDLVVADVRMEGMDGLTSIEQMRKIIPEMRSLVVSGYCNEADTIRALRLGVGDFIKKPFALQDLLDSVRRQAVLKKSENDQKAHQESFRLAFRFGLESQAQLLDQKGFQERFARIGGLRNLAAWGEGLALAVGLDASTAQTCGLLVWVWIVTEQNPQPLLEQLENHLSESQQTVLSELRQGRAGSLVARLLVAVRRYAELDDAGSETLIGMEVEPVWVECLQALEVSGLESGELRRKSQQQGQQRRGLMALATALESKGDLASAREVLNKVLTLGEISPESLEAELALARVARALGQTDEIVTHCRRAVEISARLGPSTLAVAQSKAAIQLLKVQPQTSLELFRQAAGALERFGQTIETAKARLGLWVTQSPTQAFGSELAEALRELTRPVYSDELAQCAGWLVPALLERCPQAQAAQQALFQVARLFPGEYHQLLRSNSLQEAARSALVPILLRAANEGSRHVLRSLSADSDAASTAARQALAIDTPVEPVAIRLYTLGRLAVYRGDQLIPDRAWKRLKNRLLFARLASAEGVLAEDVLIEDFWPGSPEKGRQNIYSATSTIRRCLLEGDSALELVIRSGLGLTLSPQLPLWHDLGEVQENLSAAQPLLEKGREAEAYQKLRLVHQLYKGPYLEGCYQNWALNLRHRLENEVIQAFCRLCQWLDGQKRAEELGEFARWMLGLDSCCQQAHTYMMRSLLLGERPEEAIRHFERTRQLLAQELEMEPSIELVREHQRALLSLS